MVTSGTLQMKQEYLLIKAQSSRSFSSTRVEPSAKAPNKTTPKTKSMFILISLVVCVLQNTQHSNIKFYSLLYLLKIKFYT